MKRYGEQELADLGTQAKPTWSFRDLPGTGLFAQKATTGAGATPEALNFSVAGALAGQINDQGQLFLGGTPIPLAGNVKMFAYGDTWSFGCVRSYTGSNFSNTSRGFRQSIDGMEFFALYCDNSNIILSGLYANLWTINPVSGNMAPVADNSAEIGSAVVAVKNIYLNNAPASKADSRAMTNTRILSGAEIAAWSSVSPKIFNQYGQTVKTAGYVAQDVINAFSAQGLDVTTYNLLYLYFLNGDIYYGLRMAECAMFEAAYLRSLALNPTAWRQIGSATYAAGSPTPSTTFTGLDALNDFTLSFDGLRHNYTTAAQAVALQFSTDGVNFGGGTTITNGFADTQPVTGVLRMTDIKGPVIAVDTCSNNSPSSGNLVPTTLASRIIKPNGILKAVRIYPAVSGAYIAGTVTARGR